MTDIEINEAVARKLGLKQNSEGFWDTGESMEVDPPKYCTDIQAAWEVVERGYIESVVRLKDGRYHAEPGSGSEINTYYEIGIYDPPHSLSKDIIANTAPMAICVAFLKLDLKEKL